MILLTCPQVHQHDGIIALPEAPRTSFALENKVTGGDRHTPNETPPTRRRTERVGVVRWRDDGRGRNHADDRAGTDDVDVVGVIRSQDTRGPEGVSVLDPGVGISYTRHSLKTRDPLRTGSSLKARVALDTLNARNTLDPLNASVALNSLKASNARESGVALHTSRALDSLDTGYALNPLNARDACQASVALYTSITLYTRGSLNALNAGLTLDSLDSGYTRETSVALNASSPLNALDSGNTLNSLDTGDTR